MKVEDAAELTRAGCHNATNWPLSQKALAGSGKLTTSSPYSCRNYVPERHEERLWHDP